MREQRPCFAVCAAAAPSICLPSQVYRVKPASSLPPGCLCLFFLFLACSLAGCAPLIKAGGAPGLQQNAAYYRPPTPVGAPGLGAPAPASGQPALPLLPTATIQCKDSLAFLKDITIPDGTVVAPDSTLDKRWEIENNGNCNWGQDYRVRLIAGTELGAQKEQALYPARSGSRAVIRMVFKAPAEPGTYRSAWQAYNPQGEPFGDPFFIEIKVEAAGTQ